METVRGVHGLVYASVVDSYCKRVKRLDLVFCRSFQRSIDYAVFLLTLRDLESFVHTMSKDKHDQFSECIEHYEKHEAPGDVIDDGDFQRLSRSVVRKLDLTLLPIVWVLYLFNYIDRNSIRSVSRASNDIVASPH